MSDYPIIPLGTYRHYKEKDYELIGIAKHSETEEFLAVYQPLYGDRALWVRPLDMFLEQVEIIDESGATRKVQRFQYINE